MLYGLFDLKIQINEMYSETEHILKDYLLCGNDSPDMLIQISEAEIAEERSKDTKNSNAYLEMVCIFRHITEEIADFDGMFVHSAVIAADEKGYMLTGKSGAGKSTLAIGWLKYVKNARVINGDKPILRFFPDGIYAYGSPWCGTEGLNANGKVKLFSGGFVVQSKQNFVTPIGSDEVFKRLLNQTVMPKNPKRRLKHFELLDSLIKEIPFCEINCDISQNAVEMSHSAMDNMRKNLISDNHSISAQ